MPTPIQIEAQRLLDEEKKKMETFFGIGKIGGAVTQAAGIPGGKLVFDALYGGIRKLDEWRGPGEYETELQKVVRGERDTLPEPPDDDYYVCS